MNLMTGLIPIPRYFILPFQYSHTRMQWYCSNCHAPYNRDHIESGLIQAVQKRNVAFNLQDLICVKCRGVSHMTIT